MMSLILGMLLAGIPAEVRELNCHTRAVGMFQRGQRPFCADDGRKSHMTVLAEGGGAVLGKIKQLCERGRT